MNNGTNHIQKIEKVKTIFLKSKWVDYSTNNAYKLSIDEQKALFLKFASFSLEINPYLKIKELETKIQDLETEIAQLKNEIDLLKNSKSKNRNHG